jgi:hypothetical protein
VVILSASWVTGRVIEPRQGLVVSYLMHVKPIKYNKYVIFENLDYVGIYVVIL